MSFYRGKRWVRIPDRAKVMFCENGCEGTIDRLTNWSSALVEIRILTQYYINVGYPDRTLAMEDTLTSIIHETSAASADTRL
jgi:hypothetical protein